MYVIGGATTLPGSARSTRRPALFGRAVEEYDPAPTLARARFHPDAAQSRHGRRGDGKIYVIGDAWAARFVSSGSSNVGIVEEYEPATTRGERLARACRARAARCPRGLGRKDLRHRRRGPGLRDRCSLSGAEATTRGEQLDGPPQHALGRHGLAGAVVGNRLHMVSGDVQSAGTGVHVHTESHDAYELDGGKK